MIVKLYLRSIDLTAYFAKISRRET